MEKPTEAIVRLFTGLIPDDPAVQRRSMFGMPCAFVNGQMFLGTFEDSLVLRVGPTRAAALHGEAGLAVFSPPRGGAWKDYLQVSPALLGDDTRLPGLVAEALTFTAAAPPKKKKAARPAGLPKRRRERS
jgi:TfoX/Sxy family transcriptional regulator of competence genes